MKETVDFKKLVSDALSGNEKAFEELYHLTENTAYQTAFRILQNEDDVQDVMQNAYIKANDRLKELQNPEKFENWLKSIVENECKNYIKKEKRISAPLVFLKHKTEHNSEEWRDPIPQEHIEREELRSSVTQIIEKLSPETRACIVLFHFEDKSLEQISEILEIPLGTVKSRLHNGRKQIEKEFNKLRKKDPTLYGIAAIPAVISLFAYNAANSTVPAAVSQAVLSSAVGSASAGAATAATAGVTASAAGTAATVAGATAASSGTAAAATGAAASIAVKVAAVAIAGSVVTGGSVAIKNYVETKNEVQTTSAYSSAILEQEEETLTIAGQTSDITSTETVIFSVPSSFISTAKANVFSTKANKTYTSVQTTEGTVASTSKTVQTTETVNTTTATTTATTTVTTTAVKPTTTSTTKATTTEAQEVTFTTKRSTTTETTTNPEENYSISGSVITEYTGSESSVTIPATIGSDAVTAIGAGAFAGNSYIRAVSIPSSVTQIGQEAFAECGSLFSVSLPSSLEMIGIGAFYGCTNLTSVSIPHGTQSIGDEAFAGCSALKSITIPESVTSIADDAFTGCDFLTIKCKEGSAAYDFAVANSINYSLI